MLQRERCCGPELDVWSLGVTIYSLCCGKFPFWEDINAKIQKIEYPMPPSFSPDLQDLIRKILCPRKNRLSLDQIAGHPWVRQFDKSLPSKKQKSKIVQLLEHVFEFIQYLSVLFVIRNNFFLTPWKKKNQCVFFILSYTQGLGKNTMNSKSFSFAWDILHGAPWLYRTEIVEDVDVPRVFDLIWTYLLSLPCRYCRESSLGFVQEMNLFHALFVNLPDGRRVVTRGNW